MRNESLSEWEQEHIHMLTSRQMGAWLGRRENRLLDEIKAEIERKCCITVGRENDPAITLYDVFKIIDGFKEVLTWIH